MATKEQKFKDFFEAIYNYLNNERADYTRKLVIERDGGGMLTLYTDNGQHYHCGSPQGPLERIAGDGTFFLNGITRQENLDTKLKEFYRDIEELKEGNE